MNYLTIGPYGALTLPEHMRKRPKQVFRSQSLPIFHIFNSMHNHYSSRKSSESQLSKSSSNENLFPLQSSDAIESVALSLLSSQELESSDQEDFFPVERLDALEVIDEAIFLDRGKDDKLEQAFIFWSNVSFDGCELFNGCEDKEEFVKNKRAWCEENQEFCSSISLLSIINCDLKVIPEDILCFKNLKHLDASGNKLVDVSHLSKLVHLERLYLQYNDLKALPDGFFSQMDNLKEVFVNNNKIKYPEKLIHSCAEKSFRITVHPQAGDWELILL